MPIFNNLIMPLKYTIIDDLIARLLSDELENQEKLAASQGLTSGEIRRNIHFNIFSGHYRPPDIEEMPCVTIIAPKLSFDDTQSISGLRNNLQVSIILWAAAINSKCKEIHADKSADIRMKYLISQVVSILQSQRAESIYTENGIRQTIFKSCKLIEAPFKEQPAETVLGYELVIEMLVEEIAEQLRGIKFDELCINYLPEENFSNPILRILFDKQPKEN